MMRRSVLGLVGLLLALSGIASAAGSENGIVGAMPAYYDGELFTINLFELSDTAAEEIIANNQSLNVIYMSDEGLPGGEMFVSVIDAIQGDGFNPLWLEVQITFNPGFQPVQFLSDDEVLQAAASGEITLTDTEEFYRCSVVGHK